jgi:antitoxin component YwqK of YwqJK toxin-antitoxin module
MIRVLFIIIILFNSNFGISQDTTWVSYTIDEFGLKNPVTSDFIVQDYDSINRKWQIKHYSNYQLEVVELLASDKRSPIDSAVGYFPNGNIAFIKNYYFDGDYSALHGSKIEYHTNGFVKRSGKFYFGVKSGTWHHFDSTGKILKRIDFAYQLTDSLIQCNHEMFWKTVGEYDTTKIGGNYQERTACLNFGRNGFDVDYKNGNPFRLKLFLNQKLVFSTKEEEIIKKLLTKPKLH